MMPGGASPLPLESVALHPGYERMLVIVAGDGSRWHYLQTQGGELELGRPYLAPPMSDEHGLFIVHLWAPLALGALPRVLKVERHPCRQAERDDQPPASAREYIERQTRNTP